MSLIDLLGEYDRDATERCVAWLRMENRTDQLRAFLRGLRTDTVGWIARTANDVWTERHGRSFDDGVGGADGDQTDRG